jgi:hypothetical protein
MERGCGSSTNQPFSIEDRQPDMDVMVSSTRSSHTEARMTAAWVAAVLGLVVGLTYAAISGYWAIGGTALLDTVGGQIEQAGRSGGAAVTIGLWAVVLVKIAAAALPLLALSRILGSRWHRLACVLTWVDTVILTLYGLVLTIAGLLIQADVVHTRPDADHRALRWHAYLWDPWFLLWGLLAGAALLFGRPRHPLTAPTSASASPSAR